MLHRCSSFSVLLCDPKRLTLWIFCLYFFSFCAVAAPTSGPPPTSALIKLAPSSLGVFMFWSHAIAYPLTASAISTQEGFVVAGGNQNTLFLLAFSTDGTRLWMQNHALKGFSNIVALYPTAKGYAGLANISDKAQFLTFTSRGALVHSVILDQDKATALIPLTQGGWAAAVGNTLFFLNAQGNIKTHYSYLADTPHSIQDLAQTQDGLILATGWMEEEGERHAWSAAFDEKGGLLWQRSYEAGTFSAVAPLGVHYGLAVGTQDSRATALVFKRQTGDMVWERIFIAPKGETLSATDVWVRAEDGMVALLFTQKPLDKTRTDSPLLAAHARLICLTPHAKIISDNAYYEGLGLIPTKLLPLDNNTFTLIGRTQEGGWTAVFPP